MATLLMPPDHHSSNKVLFPPLPFMGSAAVYAVDGSRLGAASIHHQQQQQQQARRSKKGKNGQKKQPQRGLGVAELEKRRMQEEQNKEYILGSSFGSSPFAIQSGVSSICLAPSHALLHHQFQPFGPQRISMLKPNAAEFVPLDQAENAKPQQQLVMMDGHHSVLLSASSSSSRKQPADSGSCKSGLSDVHDYPTTMTLGFCSSPSPCSSHTIVPDKEQLKSHSNNAASSSAAHFHLNKKHACFMGDSKAAALFLACGDPSNVHSGSSKRPRSSTPDSKRDDHHHRFLPHHQQQQQQQMNSGGGGGNKECSPFRLAPDVELFDPAFRRDCRDWPGVFSVPAIKELSSFQIPGNTSNQALSSANRAACDKKGPWPVVQDRPNRCFEGTDSLDDHPNLGAHYTPGSIMNALNSSSSSPCFSPASSWQENQPKMAFSLDGQLKDSCSSSLNNNISPKSRINHLEATSSKGDFLALRLASSGTSDHESEVSNNNNNKWQCYGMLKHKHEKFLDDGDSTQKLSSHQEASGETEDCTWPITKLQPCMNPRKIKSPLLLELSLKVPCNEGSSSSSSSLDLKLAL